MFKRILSKIREVMMQMGLIKGLKSTNELKDVDIDERMYNEIDRWKALYQGYLKDIHEVDCFSIERGRYTRDIMSLKMPKVISEEMASLVFNEKCEINIDDDQLKTFIWSINLL